VADGTRTPWQIPPPRVRIVVARIRFEIRGRYEDAKWLDTDKHSRTERWRGCCRRRARRWMSLRKRLVLAWTRWSAGAVRRCPSPLASGLWTAAARFEAVLTTAPMDEAARSAWCRKNGVYCRRIWPRGARRPPRRWPSPQEARWPARSRPEQDRRRIKELERDLRRKDRRRWPRRLPCWCSQKKSRRSSTRARTNDRTRRSPNAGPGHPGGARGRGAVCAWPARPPASICARCSAGRPEGLQAGDRRPAAVRPVPAHALTADERLRVLAVANEPRFADMPPARIVPALADEGTYLASESTFCRMLREHGQNAHRGRAKAPRQQPSADHPHRQRAAGGLVLGHDLPAGQGRGHLVLPVPDPGPVQPQDRRLGSARRRRFSARCAFGARTALAEGIAALDQRPVLHGDNGATLKATTVLAMLHWLGVKPSYSRPRVSDDNAFVESLFRTAKYRPEFPARGFDRIWMTPETGRRASCIGTTTSTGTAESATSARRNAMPVTTTPSSRRGMPSTCRLARNAIRHAGRAIRATGRRHRPGCAQPGKGLRRRDGNTTGK
jgi:putative transposase